MLTVAILDDENAAISVLKHKLNKHFIEDVEILTTWNHPQDALEQLPNLPIDLLFLDVDMPTMTGLELLDKLPQQSFQVIFTTAYQEYAISAIRKSALDYLVKPIDENDLVASVERAIEAKAKILAEKGNSYSSPEQLLAAIKSSQAFVDKISIPSQEGLILIPINEIIRIEASGSYSMVHTMKIKTVASKNLSEFEDILVKFPNFFRTHKSHIVNINHITRYLRGEGGTVILTDQSEIEVARRRKDALLVLLK